MIRLLDQRSGRLVPALYLTMLHSAENTHLPALVEAFGEEGAIKFLDLFAGVTLRVPARPVIEQALRDVRIWMEMATKPEVGPELATEYGLDPEAIGKIYRDMVRRMEQLGIVAHEGLV